MKTTSLVAALLLLATAVAVLPSTQAIESPPQCQSINGCCGIEPAFAPCCSVLSCPPVLHCPTLRVHTSDFLAYMGPHASIDLYSDCSASVCLDQTGTCCVVDGPLSRCSAISAAAIPLPVVCITEPCCSGPCPPPCDGCEPQPGPCPEAAVATSQLFAYLGPHAGVAVHGDCTVDAWGSGMVCSALLPREQTITYQAGPAGLAAEVCLPVTDCTCPPMMATAADIDPPVHVEPVVCVTDPCPPRVWCEEQSIDGAYLFGVSVASDCSITVGIVDGHRVCGFNGLQHNQVRQTIGPLTLVVNYCTPYLECTCDPILRID